jgi:ankyrin repeat protein
MNGIVKLIESTPEAINEKYEGFGETLLHYAARYGRIDIVEYLISKGADPNATDGARNTPLHDAVGSGNIQIIKLLLDSGADKYATKQTGHTAAELADSLNNWTAVKYINEYEYEPVPTKGVHLD